MISWRLLGLGVAATVAMGVILALLAVAHQRPAPRSPSSTQVAPARAVFGLYGLNYDVAVTTVQRDTQVPGAPPLSAGHHYVRLEVRFSNRSADQQMATSSDFALIYDTGARQAPLYAGTWCPRWQADLHPKSAQEGPPRDRNAPQTGPDFGPQPLCFEAAGPVGGPLTVVWTPHVGFSFLDSPTAIRLP